MVEAQEREDVNRGMRMLWVIWAGMFGSLLIYIFICHHLGEGFKNAAGSDFSIGLLRAILFGVGGVALLMAYFLRRSMLAVRADLPKPKPIGRMVGWNTAPFLVKYAAAVIISLAFSESMGIYGFVLFMLGGGFETLYIFIVVSALAMVFYRPKREELEKLSLDMGKRMESAPEM